MSKHIRIATRNSPLALIQAEDVRRRLMSANPDLAVDIIGMTTTGDRTATAPHAQLSGKGDFLKELEVALLKNEADLAIHSMKDVPAVIPPELKIQSVGPRMDARDVLVGVRGWHELDIDDRIGTSSQRRQALLKYVMRRSNVGSIRGNVGTRLKKLENEEFQALILASAGLARLGMTQWICSYLDPTIFVPAAGQGVLAAEYRERDVEMQKLITSIQQSDVEHSIRCERYIVKELQADCSAPIGIYCRREKGRYHVNAIVLDRAGDRALTVQRSHVDAQKLAEDVSKNLVALGARRLFTDP